MRLRRELESVRRFAVPAAILVGLFLLVSTPQYHAALTTGARAYVLCAFLLLFGGLGSGAAGAVGEAGRPWWTLVRAVNGAALVATIAVWRLEAATPIPPGLLVLLGLALAAGCWWPPHRR